MKNIKIDNNKKRRGFTLVEMVIVITILGLLSGIGFMKFGEVQQDAKVSADKVAASSLFTATNLAIQGGKIEIDSTNGASPTLENLKTWGYISVEPKPQSKGKDSAFEIKISQQGDVSIMIDGKDFYPENSEA